MGGEKPEGKKSPFLPFSESSIKTGFLKITPSKFVPTRFKGKGSYTLDDRMRHGRAAPSLNAAGHHSVHAPRIHPRPPGGRSPPALCLLRLPMDGAAERGQRRGACL